MSEVKSRRGFLKRLGIGAAVVAGGAAAAKAQGITEVPLKKDPAVPVDAEETAASAGPKIMMPPKCFGDEPEKTTVACVECPFVARCDEQHAKTQAKLAKVQDEAGAKAHDEAAAKALEDNAGQDLPHCYGRGNYSHICSLCVSRSKCSMVDRGPTFEIQWPKADPADVPGPWHQPPGVYPDFVTGSSWDSNFTTGTLNGIQTLDVDTSEGNSAIIFGDSHWGDAPKT